MVYLYSLQFKYKHRYWPWRMCLHLARRERSGLPPVDADAVVGGVCVVVGVLLLLWIALGVAK